MIVSYIPASRRAATAARRRVKNNRFKEQRAAATASRKGQPWTGESLDRQLRAAIDRIHILQEERTAASVMLSAIVKAPPPEIHAAAFAQLAGVQDLGRDDVARRAYEIANVARMTVRDRWDLERARKYLDRRPYPGEEA